MHRRTSDLPIVEVNWDDTEDTLGDIGVYGIHSGIVDLSDFFLCKLPILLVYEHLSDRNVHLGGIAHFQYP